jgi:sigma-B regulation protein RsbU (phosphoserine phosphatase)
MHLHKTTQLEPGLPISASRAVAVSVETRTAPDPRLRGGDVFDTHQRADGSTSILLADLSSKGSLGIAHAEMLRHAFRRIARTERCPSYMMAELDRLPFNGSAVRSYVTFAAAVIVTIGRATESLCYASAGHDTALIVQGRRHAHLAPTGPVLGVLPDARFADCHVAFGTADLLVLATDGFTECRDETSSSRQFGTTGIVRALGSAPQQSHRSACRAIALQTDVFTGGRYRDDATLAVIARCNP